MLPIAEIEQPFNAHGERQHSSEPVTQLQHALQTTCEAEQSGGVEDIHQNCVLPFPSGLFPDSLLNAIKPMPADECPLTQSAYRHKTCEP